MSRPSVSADRGGTTRPPSLVRNAESSYNPSQRMASSNYDRRRFQRITLTQPMVSKVGDVSAYIVDISISGARIVHQNPLPGQAEMRLSFEWQGRPMRFVCKIIGTERTERKTRYGTQVLFYSGLTFSRDLGDSSSVLKEMIGHYVEKALDEQLSNARGVPPIAANSYQAGRKMSGYLEFVLKSDGTWARSIIDEPKQPKTGFTISTEESEEQIAMLCASYAEGDGEVRELIQRMAQLSISSEDGVPTRRYVP